MSLSVAEVQPTYQVKHPELKNPLLIGKIYFAQKRRMIERHKQLKKIGESLRSDDSWLSLNTR